MYRITFANGTVESGINFIVACQQIQNRPSVNWRADVGEWIDGVCKVRLDGRIIATITAA
jgi:hypothetical protein